MQFMALKDDDARLRTTCAMVTKAQLRLKEQQLEIDALLEYVHGHGNKAVRGGEAPDPQRQSVVGLSANQVGLMKMICAVDLSIGHKGYYDHHVLVNPVITWRSKAMVNKNEGCVNFPSVRGITKRARTVVVEALDRSGNELRLKLTGWPAVLLQHEVDHLNGRLFIDRLVDPKHADYVGPDDFAVYRKLKGGWEQTVDVSSRCILEP